MCIRVRACMSVCTCLYECVCAYMCVSIDDQHFFYMEVCGLVQSNDTLSPFKFE